MPPITTDGQSLTLNGRRLWLVSGALHYARIPRGLWASRLAAARDAGLNCIEAPVPWSRHEPRPGVFDFQGENDLAEFVRLVGAMGMHCALRAGPAIGDAYDLGGLPAWLLPSARERLRSGAPEFLTACSRYIAALCAQVRDLQATNPRKRSGPIVLLLSDYQWYCGDEAQGSAYLGELDRFFRENGMSVPFVGAHNLFHGVEGQIDAWCGRNRLHSNMRQLRVVHPDQPRFVAALGVGAPALWGVAPEPTSPALAVRRVAEALAAGAQVNLSPFCAGLATGAGAGRTGEGRLGFLATSAHEAAPIDQAGRRGPVFNALRRVCLFASQFSRLFANLDSEYQPVTPSLDAAVVGKGKPPTGTGSVRVVESRGPQGCVAWVFAEGEEGGQCATLTLGDGTSLPVRLGELPVGWALFDAHLVDRATLDYCSLCALALVGSTFVCFGVAGSTGLISINGSAFEAVVPGAGAKEPSIARHEGITIVLCHERMIDATVIGPDAVFVGAAALDESGAPRGHRDYARIVRIDAAGERATLTTPPRAGATKAGKGKRSTSAPTFSSWLAAGTDDYVVGVSDRYALTAGPAEMQELGASSGYGWVRLRLRRSSGGSVSAGFFEGADRLHIFVEGTRRAIAGSESGAGGDIVALPLRKGENTLTVLIDNMGRRLEGGARGERKGLYGHALRVAHFGAGAARLATGTPIRPLDVRSPVMGFEASDATDPQRLTWKFRHRSKTPLILTIDGAPIAGVVVLNGEPMEVLGAGARTRIILRDDRLARGSNTLQIAGVGDMRAAQGEFKKAVSLYEGIENLTEKAEWAFARWEPPARGKFRKVEGSAEAKEVTGRPRWWKGEFAVERADRPLFFEAEGLSKGCMTLNGRDVGRYFVGPGKGTKGDAGFQSRYYLPEPWLKVGEANELLLFDEHGRSPVKCRLVYED